MSRTIQIATTILLGCLILAGIVIHIKYMCWERHGFAVGGEWIVYLAAVTGFGLWVTDDAKSKN